MTTRHQADKGLLGDPESVLSTEWLEAVFSGADTEGIIPWAFRNRPQLPTNRQVLLLYFFHRDQKKKAQKVELLRAVKEDVELLWGMAGIKTMSRRGLDNKLLKLLVQYQAVMKDSTSSMKAETVMKKREEWTVTVDKLFDCAAADAEEVLRKSRLLGQGDKEEDINFLLDQRTTRLQHIGERDKTFDKKKVEKDNREERLEMMKEKENDRMKTKQKEQQEEKKEAAKREMDNEDKENEEDPDYGVETKKSKRPDKVPLELPKAPFDDPFVAATLDRLKITSNQAMGIFGALVKTSVVDGQRADLNQFVISKRTLDRQRDANRELAAVAAMTQFKSTKPQHSAIHWDSKFLTDSVGEGWEAEAILVSGAPNWLEGKLLDVAELVDEEGGPSSTGQAQFQANKEMIKLWDLKRDVRAFVFDTTASNTGCRKGCCTLLEKWLGRQVLWLGCRHHISELVAKGSWHIVFDEDLSPDNKLMSSFKKMWDDLDTSSEADLFTITEDLPGKAEAIQFYLDLLSNKDRRGALPRDDYRELPTLALRLLGVMPPFPFTFKKPGPCHKARFMAFCLYCLKMLLLIQQLDLDEWTQEGLVRLGIFFVLVYIPYFLKATVGADAAFNDLSLHKQLVNFIDVDGPIATAALDVLSRHGWYTAEETVPFCLFSNKLSDDEKSRVAARILSYDTPESVTLGKPTFQELDEKTELHDLVGPKSYVLFSIMGLDYDWLRQKPEEWDNSTDYQEMREFVRTVKVSNDAAERGVKMISDYAKILTQDNSMRRKLLQGVEMSRKINPDFTKKTLNTDTRW